MSLDPKFEEWAVENGFSIEVFGSDGYFSEKTKIVYKGYLAGQRILSDAMYDYGICQECNTHYVAKEYDVEKDTGIAMQCDCCVDGYRRTKIMDLMNDPHPMEDQLELLDGKLKAIIYFGIPISVDVKAKWVAVDGHDGNICWYAEKPYLELSKLEWGTSDDVGSTELIVNMEGVDWKETLMEIK